MQNLDTLFDYLVRFRAPDVFNQYAEVNLAYDRPDGAERRRGNMRRYLECFHDATYVLVSEAPGYAGCRFSGVSFTDERFLFGEQSLPWVRAAGGFSRASRDDRPLSREMSATIVWSALGDRRDIVFWPAFPWHPIGPRGPMSNRAPRREELRTGREVLQCFLETLFPGRVIIAVGRHGHASLAALGYGEVSYIRHPAQGGATEFRRGIAALPRGD
jgi:hypothetical protein